MNDLIFNVLMVFVAIGGFAFYFEYILNNDTNDTEITWTEFLRFMVGVLIVGLSYIALSSTFAFVSMVITGAYVVTRLRQKFPSIPSSTE